LAAVFSAVGIIGGWMVGVLMIGVDAGAFWSQMQGGVDVWKDVGNGVVKSIVFGVTVTFVALLQGYEAQPTPEGVSRATTRTVVVASLAVLALDFVLTAMMFSIWWIEVDMQRSKNDVWVGLFVLLGAAAILFLALKSANLLSMNFQTTYNVTARFDNVGGLKRQAAVKSAGVVVGRVDSVTFDDKTFQATVTLALENRFQFPKDSSLKILTSGLLGEQYIGIEAGSEADNLKAGDRIQATQSAVVLENLISQFLYNKAAEPAPTSGSKWSANLAILR